MARQSFLDPNQTGGNLPVKVLAGNVIQHFQTLHSEFLDEIKHEVQYGGLDKYIIYDDRISSIVDLASLELEDANNNNTRTSIHINEPYLAFLWTLCYAVLTLYREQKNTPYSTNKIVKRAEQVFNYGLLLFRRWVPWDLNLPNPQEVDEEEADHIGQVNGLFIYAACFVLCHEFSHQQLGHSFFFGPGKEEEFKQDEFNADKAAVETLLRSIEGRSEGEEQSTMIGVTIGISSILFVGEEWKGGDTHPDNDERVKHVIDLLTDDPESDLWRYAIVILLLWGIVNKKVLMEPAKGVSAKDNFRTMAEHFKDQQ